MACVVGEGRYHPRYMQIYSTNSYISLPFTQDPAQGKGAQEGYSGVAPWQEELGFKGGSKDKEGEKWIGRKELGSGHPKGKGMGTGPAPRLT